MRVTVAALRARIDNETPEIASEVHTSTPLSRYVSAPAHRSPSIVPQAPTTGSSRRGSSHATSPRNTHPAIPTYDEALAAFPDASQDVPPGPSLTLSAYHGTDGPSLAGITTSAVEEEEEEDDDDPLIPRLLRAPPERTLRPLRRLTEPILTSRAPSPVPDDAPSASPSLPPSQLDPLTPAHALELPAPPADALPSYSAHLARDELRLISTVHLDQNHPAAAFFSAMTASAITANPLASPPPATDELETGGKKLKVTISCGGESMNGSGRVFVRMGRGGVVEGKIHVGRVDHATGLEISIIGLVNTSYYVRGQYTLIDTLPLARRQLQLYPPPDPNEPSAGGGDAAGTTSDATPGATHTADTATPGPSSPPVAPSPLFHPAPPTPRTSNRPISPHAPYTVTGDGARGAMVSPGIPNDASADRSNPVKNFDFRHFKKLEPVYEDMVPQNSAFTFSLRMPETYYRDDQVPLPPSAQIFQVGMQCSVEYFLRIKLTRKSWRLNEAIGIPIIYEPRAFVTPRRLRALTTDDALNPGWRSIRLHGGAPSRNTDQTAAPRPGVEVTLLLPSPPILFIPADQPPPPIPFHLHFHSASTLPLATFSDPNQCHFIVRLMRVASMRIGSEREMRRMEIPSKVEIWQEGGPHMTLGPESRPQAHGLTGSATSNLGMPARPPEPQAADTGSVTPAPAITSAPTPALTPTRPSSRRRSFSERASFLRRRSSSTSATAPTAAPAPSTTAPSPSPSAAIAPSASTVATIAEEPPSSPTLEPEPESISSHLPNGVPSAQPLGDEVVGSESVLTPLPLGATDVHLLGQLTLNLPETGPILLRTLVQSFMTPEIGVTYVLEVGLQPKSGAVKEAFTHVWGGGLIEVVLGPRSEGDRSMRTGMVPIVVG
ncbi:hypothetical protein BD324DRAFT_638806 [Kockovaella imperatae]|uniref:Uncharacterized protein n=1 Tax=Kockovaella imperatae TaxID=4999 RepID=A0A1Y1U748_9TREE|nr:hypothetical protein BD324DRAFT_638806 [Kockovaella imperatae]ORX33832.1 hypothetical protein BD324DRAFT_638806 [Kockovaella imperatae]